MNLRGVFDRYDHFRDLNYGSLYCTVHTEQ